MKKVFMILFIISICFVFFLFKDQKVAVLGYHAFSKGKESDPLIMDIHTFKKQLTYLKKNNYKTLSLKEFEDYYYGKRKIPRKSVLITMDDGYQSNYDLAFPLLREYGMKAVVFYIGSNDAEKRENYMSLETIRKIREEYPNIEIASHSYDLHKEGSINRGIDFIREDFKKMNDLKLKPYFAYPYGLHNKDVEQVLKEERYHLAFTFGPGKNHRKASRKDDKYLIPRLNISNDMPFWKFVLRLRLPF